MGKALVEIRRINVLVHPFYHTLEYGTSSTTTEMLSRWKGTADRISNGGKTETLVIVPHARVRAAEYFELVRHVREKIPARHSILEDEGGIFPASNGTAARLPKAPVDIVLFGEYCDAGLCMEREAEKINAAMNYAGIECKITYNIGLSLSVIAMQLHSLPSEMRATPKIPESRLP